MNKEELAVELRNIIDHLTHYSYEYLFEVHLCAQ